MVTTTERDLRALDRLVAEHVFGWTDCDWPFDTRFTESWEAAGQVVERMRELEFGFQLHRWNTEGMRHPYEAEFYSDAFTEFVAEADTAPLAVCLAALKALGVSTEP